MVSNKVKDLILEYIAENENSTKNDVVRYMKNYHDRSCRLTRVPTLDEINKFEKFGIINVSKGDRQGQAHHLSINDKNKFNQIKIELEEIEPFIKKTNVYFTRWLIEDLEEINELSGNEGEEKQKNLDNRILLINDLDRLYRHTMHRSLDDLYHLIVSTNLPREDSERFVTKIIELKSKLEYHEWTVKNENTFFNLQLANMKQIQRLIKENDLEDYFEGKKLKGKLIDPLKARIDDFKQILSN